MYGVVTFRHQDYPRRLEAMRTTIQKLNTHLEKIESTNTLKMSIKRNVDAGSSRSTHMQDLGQIFASMSHAEAVKYRHSVDVLVVSNARYSRKWVEESWGDPSFRVKFGLR
jgi:hypothetical protein